MDGAGDRPLGDPAGDGEIIAAAAFLLPGTRELPLLVDPDVASELSVEPKHCGAGNHLGLLAGERQFQLHRGSRRRETGWARNEGLVDRSAYLKVFPAAKAGDIAAA